MARPSLGTAPTRPTDRARLIDTTLTPTLTKTAPYTVAAWEIAVMNVAGGATTLTLPAAPPDRTQVGFRAIGSTTAAPLIIVRGGTDTIGDSGGTSVVEPLAGTTRKYQYNSATGAWFPASDVKTLTALDARYARAGMDVPAAAVGEWMAQGAATTQSATTPAGEMRLGPLWLPAGTYDAVSWQNDVGGSITATQRAIAYLDSVTSPGRPGVLAFDTAAIAATSGGVKTITGLSLVIPAGGGIIWCAVVTQGAPTTAPSAHRVSRAGQQVVLTTSNLALLYANIAPCWVATGVTGAAPATPTVTAQDGYTRMALRRSA